MATLNGNITATAELIRVTGTPPPPGSYFTIDSEAVLFLGASRGPTGRAFTRDYWSVDRGVAGTTKATHSNGASLTRYYPDANGGGGGGVTVDNGVDTPTAVTTLVAQGATLADDTATLPVNALVKTVTLTDAQIKALPTTAIELVPAPAAGTILVPLLVFVSADCTAGAYTNVDATFSYITVVYGDDAIEPMSLAQNSDGGGGARVISNTLTKLLGVTPVAVMLFNNGSADVNSPQNVTASAHRYDVADWSGALNLYAYNSGSGDFTGGDPANSLTVRVVYSALAIA